MQSLIASAVLTVLLNVLPRLFPSATQRAEQRIHEQVRETFEQRETATRVPKSPDQEQSRRNGLGGGRSIKVFFPWKAMLAISLVLTVVVNVAGYFAG